MIHKGSVFVALIAVGLLAAAVPLVIVWQHFPPTQDLEQHQLQINSLEKVVDLKIRLGDKINGASFNSDLQKALQLAINQAASLHNDSRLDQAKYISNKLHNVMAVNWDVIVVSDIISSQSVVDFIGIRTPSINGTLYAFWYNASSVKFYDSYLVIGRSSNLVGPSTLIDTTRTNTVDISRELDGVIRNINDATSNPSLAVYNREVGKKLDSYNKRSWTVITINYFENLNYIDAFGRLSNLVKMKASYQKEFKNYGDNYVNQIAFYYED